MQPKVRLGRFLPVGLLSPERPLLDDTTNKSIAMDTRQTNFANVSCGSPPAGRHRTTSTAAIRFQADDRQNFSAIKIWLVAFAQEVVS